MIDPANHQHKSWRDAPKPIPPERIIAGKLYALDPPGPCRSCGDFYAGENLTPVRVCQHCLERMNDVSWKPWFWRMVIGAVIYFAGMMTLALVQGMTGWGMGK